MLTAEQMQDAVRHLCDGPERLPELQAVLKKLSSDKRAAPVLEATKRRDEANLDQALQLMNSDLIRDLYLAAFSHEPREVELAKLIAHLEASPNRRQAIEDLIWSVINTNEFMFQH